MTREEFRRLVADRLDNACHDPIGRDAAIDEIVGVYAHDVRAAYSNGQAGARHVVSEDEMLGE